MTTISTGHADIVDALLMARANVSILDEKGLTALEAVLQEEEKVRSHHHNGEEM